MTKSIFKFRKVLMLCSIALGLATLLWSCDSKSGDENPELEIALQAPANDADIDLSQVSATTFSWTQVAGVSGYTLKFAPAEAGLANTSAKIDAGNIASYSLDSQAADTMLANTTSLQPGESTDMYWTVVPTVAVPNVKTQIRKFHVKRLPVTVTPDLSLAVSTESLVFAANPSAARTVNVEANIAWNVSIAQTGEWLTANPVAGSGDGSISLTATENTGAERTAVVTVSGTGVESKTVSVTQAAKETGGNTALLGAWNLKMIEGVKIVNKGKGENGKEYKGTFVRKYAGAFTLNEDGSFTGKIANLTNQDSNIHTDGKTWSYAGGSFTWDDNGFTTTYNATVTSSELVFEYGVPNTNDYAKATYTKNAVTIPPIPDQITNLYTGNASIFHGVWALTKTEDNYSNVNGDDPTWWAISFNASDEVMKLTVNNDGTFQMVNNIDNITSTGTWSFANNGTLTITESGGEQSVMKVEAESSASTLIWGNIEVYETEKIYSRMIWTKR
jgi:hypothetical protein